MKNALKNLSEFKKNTYSQSGEDGVIAEILFRISRFSELNRWCVEFGAWDGVYLSNTCRLIREDGYSAVLIEGDPKRVEQLKTNLPQQNVIKVCRFISFEGNNQLENVLAETPIPQDFDFLSIDIDGVDYHILDGINRYNPKVICIEFNPTIPNAVDFVQPKNFFIKQGSSAKAISRLANEKGYILVSVVGCNVIFVRQDLANFVIEEQPKLEDINPQGNDPQYIFAGYDGTILSNKDSVSLYWHRLNVPISKVQFLPKFFRIYRGDYGFTRRVLLGFFLLLHYPKKMFGRLFKKLNF